MNRDNNRDRDRDENGNGNGNGGNQNGGWTWWQAGATAAGVGALASLGYLLIRGSSSSEEPSPAHPPPQRDASERRGFLSNLADTLEAATNTNKMDCVVSRANVPSWPNINNLNALLADIHVRHIALKREDFQRHYRVFMGVFAQLQQCMKEVDKYYERYASNVQFAGSHYDRLRIKKPDEFDMDIVIGVPVNMRRDPSDPLESDIVIEQKSPGFVQLRAGTQYQNILIRDGIDCVINKTAYGWLDDRKYILRSKFIDWFKSVGNKGLNRFQLKDGQRVCYVDSTCYTIRTSSSGPAWTIIIEAPGFRLDVDLVPALKFPENRWLNARSYRPIPVDCRRGYWMVVPKPNKAGSPHDEQRSWRIALQEQEKQLLNNTNSLRQVIRLLKKFRDAQGMQKIASYYIKTIFFWEIIEKQGDTTFWQRNDIAYLFQHMMKKFYEALDRGSIPYFWNRNNNMIENLNSNLRNEYKRKILSLLNVLDSPREYKSVARYLLDSNEYLEYQRFIN
ncbi:cyclic GMP-AMP synthase-like receptor [Bicyclus anynana]|uniref:Cyclic GMP-AMP synthase-like receptor n=1 Tax=Bicyclus anynana TaxID=110368 RepID=A0A6J1N4M8_BICAN|nr:cyclic GMP-AMP synthase-like receptor [Bicyclus anynana]XP_023940042.2 cyclic GMP-AMP synthase-like receptor [Bicyclus anynana]